MSEGGSDFALEGSDSEFNDHEDYIDRGQNVEENSENHLDHYDESPQ